MLRERTPGLVLVLGTALFGMVQGVTSMLYPSTASTATWHAEWVGAASLAAGVAIAAQSRRWFRSGSVVGGWWGSLGVLFGATLGRGVMACWRAQRGELLWVQAVNFSTTLLFLTAAVLSLWWLLVFERGDE